MAPGVVGIPETTSESGCGMNGTQGLQKALDPGSVFDELRGSQTCVQVGLI